ncbi:hypothetical protein LCGC14_2328030 [marine sediment metagenome]|uniref:Uncharacterized protein n=1 Tax=marine sediment metagenome TaxID=412755 RepID=A0A0F9CGF1_9ZZZZ
MVEENTDNEETESSAGKEEEELEEKAEDCALKDSRKEGIYRKIKSPNTRKSLKKKYGFTKRANCPEDDDSAVILDLWQAIKKDLGEG